MSDLVGTPFVPGGRLPGVGLDCLGVVLVGLERRDGRLADCSMTSCPTVQALRLLKSSFEIDPAGEIGLFDVAGEAHLAWIEGGRMIHASRQVGRVVEHGMDERWRRRLVGRWRAA